MDSVEGVLRTAETTFRARAAVGLCVGWGGMCAVVTSLPPSARGDVAGSTYAARVAPATVRRGQGRRC